MQYSYAGAARVGSSGFHAIKSPQHHRSNVLTSDSFRAKSQLQKLFDWLVSTVNQRGNPNA